VFLRQNLWELVGSRQSYCNNNQAYFLGHPVRLFTICNSFAILPIVREGENYSFSNSDENRFTSRPYGISCDFGSVYKRLDLRIGCHQNATPHKKLKYRWRQKFMERTRNDACVLALSREECDSPVALCRTVCQPSFCKTGGSWQAIIIRRPRLPENWPAGEHC